ncbi:hypothetical protein B0H17DRAFT_1131125 [Mycena rosella]|uniref:Uncharacterized protein n=1 Tax=Mycena rosella TaxID=1033263 RepID=A0AAD7DQL0_MYCRO|nr:hypothetical protein B0H17DRAFT_1131125 [Mycena rosella]
MPAQSTQWPKRRSRNRPAEQRPREHSTPTQRREGNEGEKGDEGVEGRAAGCTKTKRRREKPISKKDAEEQEECKKTIWKDGKERQRREQVQMADTIFRTRNGDTDICKPRVFLSFGPGRLSFGLNVVLTFLNKVSQGSRFCPNVMPSSLPVLRTRSISASTWRRELKMTLQSPAGVATRTQVEAVHVREAIKPVTNGEFANLITAWASAQEGSGGVGRDGACDFERNGHHQKREHLVLSVDPPSR